MRKFFNLIGWLASLGLLLAACAAPTATPTVAPTVVRNSPQPGDNAPDFTLADSNGNSLHLTDIVAEHKSTVLVFYLSHT
jgi:hypothetical protein